MKLSKKWNKRIRNEKMQQKLKFLNTFPLTRMNSFNLFSSCVFAAFQISGPVIPLTHHHRRGGPGLTAAVVKESLWFGSSKGG